ncbi:hypothetical protein OIU85_003305 [Salix viminalis]|uniref:Histidine--tRNA ligase, cytoplasmic n=1 Tax=Salix viminalis TaxID=40686 RepID=A0A9Q0PZ66_SALVM|nr:hypothetical protein OIU85_003305 [Salix viminalis]
MAAYGDELKIITIGGKGSALTSTSVYTIATGHAQVRIDSSALDRLTNQNRNPQKPLHSIHLINNEASNLIETRAYLTVLLNKLLHYTNSSNVRTFLPNLIAETLNSNKLVSEALGLDVEVTEEERLIIEGSSAELYGVCAILDHEGTGLGVVDDAVAALSCEAVKADVRSFDGVDSGDGFVDKEAATVASDMKVLLVGYDSNKRGESEAVSEIPKVNGRLREVVKALHTMVRVELNSGVKGSSGGSRKAVGTTVSGLAIALLFLGKSSLCRVKMNLDVMGKEGLGSGLVSLFEKKCPSRDVLTNGYKAVTDLLVEEDYVKFGYGVYGLLGIVWKIVAWEEITAFFALEGAELMGGIDGQANEGETKVVKKSEKKKKKKTVLGKGTSVIVQLIKDRLQIVGGGSGDCLDLLENWVENLMSFFSPKQPEFDEFVQKVKEIVERNESRRLPKLPKGTRDFANEQMVIRERAFSIIADVFKRHGATSLDTPAFELRETLMGKYGEDSKLIYDLADQGGELCSLRYDLTVPFARYVAMNGITSFKRYQIAKVYRRDNPSKGRYREFYQCDFDIAGQYEEMGPDFEIVKVLTELLDELNIGDYEVKLNHRKLLDGMLEICGVPPEKFRTICSSIDKLDKQSFEQVKKEMVEEKGLAVETADRIGTFVKEKDSPKELLSKLKQEGSEFLQNASSSRALDELEILFDALERSKCIDKVVFDLSLARGLDYYTGVIFEAVFKGTTQVGSIAAGGRYDNLIGMFGSKPVPAVGVSLGIERVFAIMEQLQKDRNETTRPTETQVLLGIMGNKSKIPLAAELTSKLWSAKVKAEFVVSTRFDKLISRAKDSKIPWMVLVGDREMETGKVKIKNLETKIEEEVPLSSFVDEVKNRLNL